MKVRRTKGGEKVGAVGVGVGGGGGEGRGEGRRRTSPFSYDPSYIGYIGYI